MIATQTLPAVGSLQLDAMLANALVLSWSDLIPELTSGLIHVEYRVGSQGAVEYLKVWAAPTRGQWDLVCQDFMRSSASCPGGLRFANGYKSEGLAKLLNQIMQHPEMFVLLYGPGRQSADTDPPADPERQPRSARDGGSFRDRLAA